MASPRKLPQMEEIRFDERFLDTVKIKADPAFREITAGLSDRITDMLRNPDQLGISCCFEGCCVSWCCIRLT
jgi:hypothetical protein